MIALMAMNANAKVWRLNNSGANADFTTLTAAYAGASANDTIYIEVLQQSMEESLYTNHLFW